MGLKVLVKYASCICLDSLMEKLLVEAQKMVVRLNLKALLRLEQQLIGTPKSMSRFKSWVLCS